MLGDLVGNFFLKCRSKLLVKINKTAVRYTEKVVSFMNRQQRILWNHSCSWGPILVDCQNFASSWECYFVGNCFIALKCRTIHYFVKRSWGRKFIGKVIHKIHDHWSPTNNVDSTVHLHVYTYLKKTSYTTFSKYLAIKKNLIINSKYFVIKKSLD